MDLSFHTTVSLICVRDHTIFSARVWTIIHANHRPDLAADLQNGSLSLIACPQCGTIVPPRLPWLVLLDNPEAPQGIDKIIFRPADSSITLDDFFALFIKDVAAQRGQAWVDALFADYIPVCGLDEGDGEEDMPQESAEALPATMGESLALLQELAMQSQQDLLALEQLITVCEAFLETLADGPESLLHGFVYNYLGSAYRRRRQGDLAENRQRAVALLERAATLLETEPEQYVGVLNNLGLTYLDRADSTGEPDLHKAAACFKRALALPATRHRSPTYATLHHNLGMVAAKRAEAADDGTDLAQLADRHFQEALTYRPYATDPWGYARTQNKRGDLYRTLADQTSQRELFEEAIACYREALRVWDAETAPVDFTEAAHHLGDTLLGLASRFPSDACQLFTASIEALTSALITDNEDIQSVMIWLSLAKAFSLRADISEDLQADLLAALHYYDKAITWYDDIGIDPLAAMVHFQRLPVCIQLYVNGFVPNRAAADQSIQRCLEIFTETDYPEIYEIVCGYQNDLHQMTEQVNLIEALRMRTYQDTVLAHADKVAEQLPSTPTPTTHASPSWKWSALASTPPESAANLSGASSTGGQALPKVPPGGKSPATPTTRQPELAQPATWIAQPGDTIHTGYTVLRVLQGGMSVVYLAVQATNPGTTDEAKRVPYAFKVLHPRLLASASAREHFLNEAATWIELGSHPHIVRCHQVHYRDEGPLGNSFSLRLDWEPAPDNLPDSSLRSCLRAGSPLSSSRAFTLALEIVYGFCHATSRVPGLVHRDLKPENILVGRDGKARITDFGLAIVADRALGTDGAGTAAYMAPEQWSGANIDQRADIYAFGCVFYELLTGHPAADATDRTAYREAHCAGRVARQLASVPAAIQPIIARCLALEPANRYQDWPALAAALEGAHIAVIGTAPPARPGTLPDSSFAYGLQGYSYHDIGVGFRQLGLLERAVEFQQRALAIGRQTQDGKLQAGALNALANIASQRKDYPTAIEYLRQGLTTIQESNDPHLKASSFKCTILINLTSLYLALGNHDAAQATLAEATSHAGELDGALNQQLQLLRTQLQRQQPPPMNTARSTAAQVPGIGATQYQTRYHVLMDTARREQEAHQYDRARLNAERAYELSRLAADSPLVLTALDLVIDLALETGDSQAAIAAIDEGITYVCAVQSWEQPASGLIQLAQKRYQLTRDPLASITYLAAMVDRVRGHDQATQRAWLFGQIGLLSRYAGRPQESGHAYQAALDLVPERTKLRCMLLHGLGHAAVDQGTPLDAQRAYQEACAIAQELNDPTLIGTSFLTLGDLLLTTGKLEAAEEALTHAHHTAQKYDQPIVLLNTICHMALLAQKRNDPEQTTALLATALATAVLCPDTTAVDVFLSTIPEILHDMTDLVGLTEDPTIRSLLSGLIAARGRHDVAQECDLFREAGRALQGDRPALALQCFKQRFIAAQALVRQGETHGAPYPHGMTREAALQGRQAAVGELGSAFLAAGDDRSAFCWLALYHWLCAHHSLPAGLDAFHTMMTGCSLIIARLTAEDAAWLTPLMARQAALVRPYGNEAVAAAESLLAELRAIGATRQSPPAPATDAQPTHQAAPAPQTTTKKPVSHRPMTEPGTGPIVPLSAHAPAAAGESGSEHGVALWVLGGVVAAGVAWMGWRQHQKANTQPTIEVPPTPPTPPDPDDVPCVACSRPTHRTWRFCRHCGIQQHEAAIAHQGEECHECGTPYSPTARFCRQCGAHVTRTPAIKHVCTGCGCEGGQGTRFCRQCGLPFLTSTA